MTNMGKNRTMAGRKRLFACLTLMLVIFSQLSMPASAAEQSEISAISYQLMRVVGILNENSAPDAQQQVTRSDLIRAVTALRQLSLDYYQHTTIPYTDVSQEDERYAMVGAAYYNGLIPFAAQETLQLDAPVTSEELGASLVAVLGYDSLAAAQGGYPTGYHFQAKRLRLLPAGAEETVTWGTMAKMVENALRTKPMILHKVGEDLVYCEAEQPMMTENFHLYRLEGVLRADAFTDLYFPDSELERGYVRVDDMILNAPTIDADSLLGCRIEGYYRDAETNGVNELVCAAPHDSNRQVTIGYDELLSADRNSLQYASGDQKAKTLRLSDSVVMLYNGKHIPLDIDLVWPEHGEVSVIDYNGDGRYDVIKVLDYRAVIAERVSQDGASIAVKGGGTPIMLDPNDSGYGFYIWKNGEKTDISGLAAGDVLLVAQSRGEGYGKCLIRACNAQISGTATRISDKEIEINAEEDHRIADSVKGRVKLGVDATFYLDEYGTVIDLTLGQSIVYGYLNGLRTGVFDLVEARIYTQKNHWVTLPFQNKILFNGVKTDAAEVYRQLGGSDASVYRQLITYRVSSDRKIRELNTAVPVQRWSKEEKEYMESDTFRLNFSGALYFRENGRSFEGMIAPNSDTVLFVIPKQNTGGSSEKLFSIASIQNLRELSYPIQAYDCDELFQPAACVITGELTEPNNISGPSNVMLVDWVGVGINPADEESYVIEGLYKNAMTFVYTDSKQDIDAIEGGIQKGDVIQFVIDSDGCATSIERLFRGADAVSYAASNGLYSQNCTFLTGKLVAEDKERSRISVRYSEQSAYVLDTSARLQNVYVYEKASDRIRNASLDDLAADDSIFVSSRYAQVVEIIIVKPY